MEASNRRRLMDDEFVDQISGQAELEAEAERIEREEAEREGLITEAIEDGGAPKPCRFVSDINWKDVGMPFPMGLWKRSRDIVAKIKEGGEASEAELNTLRKFTDIKIQLMKRQEIDPIKWGWSLKGAELIKKYLPIAKVLLVGGGQRCLGGNTLIYDPIRQQSQKVQDIRGSHHVWAVDSSGKTVIAEASQPFRKDVGSIYDVVLSNGDRLEVADTHLLYTPIGWLPLSELKVGCALYHFPTRCGNVPADREQGVHHSIEKALDSLVYYQTVCGLYDGQLHSRLGICQEFFPSLDGVLQHSTVSDSSGHLQKSPVACSQTNRTDDLVEKSLYNRPCQQSDHPSNLGGVQQESVHREDDVAESCVCDKRDKSHVQNDQGLKPSLFESYQQLQLNGGFERLTRVIGGLQNFSVGAYNFVTIRSITEVRRDVKWDFTVPATFNYIAGGVLNHNSGKSFEAAKVVVNSALQIPGAQIRCMHETEARSIEDQQPFIYNSLPMYFNGTAVKDVLKPKGKNYSIDYKDKSGFSGPKNGNSVCIIPPVWPFQDRGSKIVFNNYQQWINKNNVFEGLKANLIWGDEQMPYKLFETLLTRDDATVNLKILLTFTMIDGYTELVQSILGDAKTIESRYSETMGENLPVVMKSQQWPDTYVIFFWTQDNPWAGFDNLLKVIKPQGRPAMLTKLYGIPQKMSQTKFPKFHPDVHVVEESEIPKRGTNYHVADPGEKKNWAMNWYRIDNHGRMWIYREWPDYDTYGLWAELSGTNKRGSPGSAQKLLGLGFSGYADLFEKIENSTDEDKSKREIIFERIIDPRGNKERTTADGTTTVIDEMKKVGVYFTKANVGENNIVGLNMINEWFDYSPEWLEKKQKAIADGVPWTDIIEGSPKLFISEKCRNTINCLQNFTGDGGNEENTKDFVDTVKYACCSQPIHVDAGKSRVIKRSAAY